MRVKTFDAGFVSEVQAEINNWLEKSKNITIQFITQSERKIDDGNGNISICIWYK